MSRVRTQSPIIHTPSFRVFAIEAATMRRKVTELGLTLPMGMLDNWYYYTSLESWGKLTGDLMFKSNLYRPERFDCDNYALKAMNICHERYGLNTFAYVSGQGPNGPHAFNMVYHGDGFMLWEANDGFPQSGSFFNIGDDGYVPKKALL